MEGTTPRYLELRRLRSGTGTSLEYEVVCNELNEDTINPPKLEYASHLYQALSIG